MSRYVSYRDFDWVLFIFVLILCALGVLEIRSATAHTKFAGAHLKQIYWIIAGIGCMFLMSIVNYQALLERVHWMYIVAVLDWYTKKIVGYYAGIQCRAVHWLEALDMAVNRQFPDGAYGKELKLMSDNGSQPTSLSFMKSCRAMGITQAFTSYGNPKGNADTERVFRTMKEELLWLREWHSPFELTGALNRWIDSYNRYYLHSALGYKSPNKFEEEYRKIQPTQLVST